MNIFHKNNYHHPIISLRFFLFTLFLISLSIFPANANDFIAAKVNKTAITKSELTTRFELIKLLSKVRINSKLEKQAFLEQIMSNMIDEEIIIQSADKFEIKASDQEIMNSLENYAIQQNTTVKKLKYLLKRKKIPLESLIKQIKTEILWSKIISAIIAPKATISRIESIELLEQQDIDPNVNKFFIAEIFIRKSLNNSQQLSEKLTQELRNGANFNSLATQFSSMIGNEKGEIGWVSAKDVDKRIYDKISHLQKNSYSDPVLLDDGYHIFKIIDKKTEVSVSKKNMELAEKVLKNKKIQNMARSYLVDLRKKAFVENNI